MNLGWLAQHQAQATDSGGGDGTAQRETGELLTDRQSSTLYYVGRYSLSTETYTITRIEFLAGKIIKQQAQGTWEARTSLTYI